MVVQNISANGKETDLTFTIKTDDLNKTKKIIQENKIINYRKLIFEKGVSKISVIGVGMITTPGVTFRMFQTLANKKINIKVISTSEIKISVLIDKKNTQKALVALHKEFKLDHKKMSIRPFRDIKRRKTKEINVGKVKVGGNNPISVQSMTNTLTTDVKSYN